MKHCCRTRVVMMAFVVQLFMNLSTISAQTCDNGLPDIAQNNCDGEKHRSAGFEKQQRYRGDPRGKFPIIKRKGLYDYSPTVMKDSNGKFRMWWCGQSKASSTRDAIFYSSAKKIDGPWEKPKIVFQPTGRLTFDRDQTCDPSVIRVGKKYYMYYSGNQDVGAGPKVNTTSIGVAVSNDGIKWKRMNNGLPIVTPFQDVLYYYGAGQPSVVYLDNWFYMIYSEPGLTFALRSKVPTFPPHPDLTQRYVRHYRTCQDYYYSRSQTGFFPYNPYIDLDPNTPYEYCDSPAAFAAFANADLSFDKSLDMFTLAVNHLPGETTMYFLSRDFNVFGHTDIPGLWTEGPAVVRKPDGTALPFSDANRRVNQCIIPFDFVRSVSDPKDKRGPTEVRTWELSHIGVDLVMDGECPARQ